jgi:CheY-like chemotaxis protein
VLDLAQGDAAIGNPSADIAKIRTGAARLADVVRNDPSFINRYYLGIALLNLGKPDEAIGHFRAARGLRPNDSGLAAQVDHLQRALAESAPPTQRIVTQVHTTDTEAKKSVLVVDESATIRKLAAMTLRKNGFSVTEAQDGQEAWQLIESGVKPDLVLMDVNLQRMDGHALCRAIRRQPEIAKVPVVVLTSDDAVDRSPDRKAGVDIRLSKPFHPTALAKAVRDLCPADR